MRESFVFYKSFLEAIDCLDDHDQLLLYRAIAEYSINEKEPEISGAALGIFKAVRPQIDANNIRFQNGKKGGAPAGNDNAKKTKTTVDLKNNPKQPTVDLKNNPKQPNVNVNENVNVNVNENVNVNVNENVNANVAPACAEFYSSNIGILTPTILSEMLSFIDDGMSDECIVLALKESVNSNAKNWNYAKAILNRWLAEGWKTPEKARGAMVEFKNRTGAKKSAVLNYSQHDYTDADFENHRDKALKAMEVFDG